MVLFCHDIDTQTIFCVHKIFYELFMFSILQRDWFSWFLIPNLKMNFLSPCTIFGRSKFNFLICRVAWSRKLWWNIDKELVFWRENNFMKSSTISYQVKWMPLHIHACGHVANLERGCVFFTNISKEILYGPASTCLHYWRWYILLGWCGYPPALIDWLPTSFAKKHGYEEGPCW